MKSSLLDKNSNGSASSFILSRESRKFSLPISQLIFCGHKNGHNKSETRRAESTTGRCSARDGHRPYGDGMWTSIRNLSLPESPRQMSRSTQKIVTLTSPSSPTAGPDLSNTSSAAESLSSMSTMLKWHLLVSADMVNACKVTCYKLMRTKMVYSSKNGEKTRSRNAADRIIVRRQGVATAKWLNGGGVNRNM